MTHLGKSGRGRHEEAVETLVLERRDLASTVFL
jgi:hypothetical protein